MDSIIANFVGDIHVAIYETSDNEQLFYLKSQNENLIPVLDYLQDTLNNFKTN